MWLGIITLLTALAISAVAAYFSIIGLAALFAATMIPVIIMGTVLEIGKLSAVIWLHRNWKGTKYNNWKAAPRLLKGYLSASVIVLMLITSMGIFGFLSKGHLEQAIPVGDLQLRIERIDGQVDIRKREIKRLEKRIGQLDAAIDQYFENNIITRGLKVREEQKEERTSIAQGIASAETAIDKLSERRLVVRQKMSTIEAKLGPVKYAAELLFDDPEGNMDRAVRAVILAIIFAFDPLAILLILAANFTFMNRYKPDPKPSPDRKKKKAPPPKSNDDVLDILRKEPKVADELKLALETVDEEKKPVKKVKKVGNPRPAPKPKAKVDKPEEKPHNSKVETKKPGKVIDPKDRGGGFTRWADTGSS